MTIGLNPGCSLSHFHCPVTFKVEVFAQTFCPNMWCRYFAQKSQQLGYASTG